MADALERITEWEAAYDKRDPDPKKNCGIHGVTMRWVVKGPRGAVQFVVYTNWNLPEVQKELESSPFHRVLWAPLPADVGYHSPVPLYEGQDPVGAVHYSFADSTEEIAPGIKMPKATQTGTFTPCPYLDGKPCYYDGSGLQAETMFELLVREGGEAVWRELERRYHDQFDKEEPAP